MSEPVLGYGVAIEMHDGVSYKPVLCAETCTFNRSPEIIEITGPATGLYRDYMKRREGWTADVSGLTKIENDTALTFFYLLQTSVRNQKHPLRFVFTDVDGASKQVTGNVLIGEMSISGQAGDFAKGSISFIGSGAFAVTATDPVSPTGYNFMSDFFQTVNGHSYISGASSGQYTGVAFTIGDTDIIVDVDVEGTGFNIVTGTPAAGSRECRYDSATDRLNFPADLIFDGTQRVFVEIKRPV